MTVHQRGMGYAGAIIAMVIAGLIVCGIVYYGPEIWRRIQSRGGISISDVVNNPDKYAGQEIEVVGSLGMGGAPENIVIDNYIWSNFIVANDSSSLKIYVGAQTQSVISTPRKQN